MQDIECTVGGALAIILHVSRIFGLAPLHFTKQTEAWRVRVSPAVSVYSYLLVLVLNTGISFGLILDLELEPARAVRVRTPSARFVWITELVITSLITLISACTGPNRMRIMIACRNTIEKINQQINGSISQSTDKRACFFAICWLIVSFSLYIFDYYMFMRETVDEGREVLIMCLYICCYIELIMLFLIEMQFIYIGFSVNWGFKWINKSLRDLIDIVDLQKKFKEANANDETNTHFSIKPVNILVNRITPRDKSVLRASESSKVVQESVRSLSLLYCDVCEMVRSTDQGNGKVLMLLLAQAFLHLVITPYYFVSFLLSSKSRPLNIFLESMYCFYHTFKLMMVIEPGHRIATETTRTQTLISQLLQRVSPHDPLVAELDIFIKQIALNRITYSPLGICTLARPLIATIFGGVTTYIIIILQFQALDKQYW